MMDYSVSGRFRAIVSLIFLSLAATCGWISEALAREPVETGRGNYAPRSKPADGSAYPRPRGSYEVSHERGVRVPMRDGVRLHAEIFRPVGLDRPAPVILMSGPYGKTGQGIESDGRGYAHFFASHGYIFVYTHIRGHYGSEGKFTIMQGLEKDQADTANWIKAQDWSNGKIGTYGCSYLGTSQLALAKENVPGVLAHSISDSGGMGGRMRPSGNTGGRMGGVQSFAGGVNWFTRFMWKDAIVPPADLEGEALGRFIDAYDGLVPNMPEADIEAALWTLPASEVMERIGALRNDWIPYRGNALTDPYYDDLVAPKESDRFSAPSIHLAAYQDGGAATDQIYFWDLFQRNATNETARRHQHLILSPEGHCGFGKKGTDALLGDMPVGDVRLDMWRLWLEWFDHWLRDAKTSVSKWPKVRYYTTGVNKWRASDAWPPKDAVTTKLYLSNVEAANSRYGDGLLRAKRGGPKTDRYISDPANPIPSRSPFGDMAKGPAGHYQGAREARQDVLVYSTDRLSDDFEVTGNIELTVYLESTSPDVDLIAGLVDVRPDGVAHMIQGGAFRVRYRDGFDKPTLMKPGEVYKVTMWMNNTSHVFQKGHRVRLTLASSDFPGYVRNVQTGEDPFFATELAIAENTVHLGGERASFLALPTRGRAPKEVGGPSAE